MKYYNNILETIGNTPLIKLNKITKDLPCEVFAKVESFNPGNSVKDRMAVKMIEDAEKSGLIKPGGTIVEGTSGNTGMGLALASIVKGYKLICVSNDKQSKEKRDVLKAMGAQVIICPTDVPADDPKSYYSVSRKIAEDTPNSWYVNQYDNLSNSKAHYENTGPEIWNQTDGKITHFVVGVGTGGTISGVGRFLKEKNKSVKIWGIDTYGSVFKKYHETGIFDENEIYPYKTEGIGEDILPKNVDFKMGFFLMIGGVVGSTVGVNLFKILRVFGQIDIVIQMLFLIFLGFIGFSMAFESAKTTITKYRTTSSIRTKLHQHSWIHGLPFKLRFHRSKLYISAIPPIIIGFFVGVLSAMMGVGGGFIIIPAMVYLLGMSTNVVVGTSLFQIIFVTANSTFFQSYLNQTVDIVLASLMIVGGVIGAQIGARLGTKLKAEYLRGILAILVLAVCAKIFTDLTLTPANLFSLDLL